MAMSDCVVDDLEQLDHILYLGSDCDVDGMKDEVNSQEPLAEVKDEAEGSDDGEGALVDKAMPCFMSQLPREHHSQCPKNNFPLITNFPKHKPFLSPKSH